MEVFRRGDEEDGILGKVDPTINDVHENCILLRPHQRQTERTNYFYKGDSPR